MEFLNNPETWVAVAFVLFVGLAGPKIARAIGKGLDRRGDTIRAEIEEARRLREEAERLHAENLMRQREATKEAEAILAGAREEAVRLQRDAAASFEASVKRREQMALDKIAQAEAQAVADVRDRAAELAVAAAGRLLGEAMRAGRAEALVDRSIAELERKLQ